MKYGSITLGQIEAIITKLGGTDGALRFLRGDPLFIDGDAAPSALDWRAVHEHKKIGPFLWDASRVVLWQAEFQQIPGPKPHTGARTLFHKTRNRPVLNASVLDYLLENQSLIPKEWEDKAIVFWGTIYEVQGRSFEVRVLYSQEGVWKNTYFEIGAGWLSQNKIYSAEYKF